ncbi:hypothetical protein C7B61_12615, partial [filamentous cyanobacterium CCP1]
MEAPYISRPQAEKFLQALLFALEQPSQNPVVFHVWGVGGVGKSTLTRKLKTAHESTAQMAEVSFGLTEGIGEPIRLMAKLYEQIVPKERWQNNWDDDPFWAEHELYWDTVYRLNNEPVSGKGIVGEDQANQVKQLLKFGVSLFGGRVGLDEAGKKTVKETIDEGVDATLATLSLTDSVQQLLQQHRATKRDKELQALMLEPLPRLTQAFVQGLSQQAKQRPVILILDTYEKAPVPIDTWLWRTLLG